MDVDHSHDHIAFNVINVDEDSLDSDNEKEDESVSLYVLTRTYRDIICHAHDARVA
jgi:hypothetical protein